ncbi:gamma carbonic anhydrase family protein [Methylomonas sp. UP202]|uniref:gamma carbonic anhydrase family protein n=1 Tax=Methylomonas sp. UP202 TaxID=3040943 RepID=UPI0024798468|nr:gamma carbonic anhydrase family protein [Methylomonas sp. UP202]WGS84270.1 gamma carbonic anhydrase family protein [Methylomonas sp. UP202]
MAIRTYQSSKPKLGERVLIDETAVVIGSVELGDDVSVWPTAVLRGDVEKICIGNASNVQDGSILHVSHAGDYSPSGYPLRIGESVTIGHRAVIHGCTIGNYCLIGIGAIVMDGAVLGDYSMLGAGALVPPGKKLEGGYLYIGVPAKAARALTDDEKIFLAYSASHYVKLKDSYLDRKATPE